MINSELQKNIMRSSTLMDLLNSMFAVLQEVWKPICAMVLYFDLRARKGMLSDQFVAAPNPNTTILEQTQTSTSLDIDSEIIKMKADSCYMCYGKI